MDQTAWSGLQQSSATTISDHFLAIATAVSHLLRHAQEAKLPCQEESLTELIWISFAERVYEDVRVRLIARAMEARIGSDWHWYFRVGDRWPCEFRVQAKRAKRVRRAKSCDQLQVDIDKDQLKQLIARADRLGAEPLYVLYLSISEYENQSWDLARTCPDHNAWGCSVIPARFICNRNAGPSTLVSDLIEAMVPWHLFVRAFFPCETTLGDSTCLPESFSSLLSVSKGFREQGRKPVVRLELSHDLFQAAEFSPFTA